ncbi:hypothetical protein RJ639_027559 [Escallonia herrerae]|uniref:TATA box binding protein associated factor (TAF) histone-like fold domain-containing protein n=1 Tax=Escallonia herrerae TaxID=1293975 RepID=A0AA88X2Y7_9ASTE|nr:hypothetical protein RJ639_027559 [Escallonia herrerae]
MVQLRLSVDQSIIRHHELGICGEKTPIDLEQWLHISEVGVTWHSDKRKRMSIVPKETVEVVAQSIGINNLSPDVAFALAPDVEYRMHEIMQFHPGDESKRQSNVCATQKELHTTDDVDSALNLRNVEGNANCNFPRLINYFSYFCKVFAARYWKAASTCAMVRLQDNEDKELTAAVSAFKQNAIPEVYQDTKGVIRKIEKIPVKKKVFVVDTKIPGHNTIRVFHQEENKMIDVPVHIFEGKMGDGDCVTLIYEEGELVEATRTTEME